MKAGHATQLRTPPWYCWVIAAACFLALYAPLVAIVFESFVEHTGAASRFVGLQWYRNVLANPALLEPLQRSLAVALSAAIASLLLGGAGAFLTVRGRVRGKALMEIVFLAPLILPELVLGIALLIIYALLRIPLGLVSIFIAHTTFCFSYSYVLIKTRLEAFDLRLEEAALDLGAPPLKVFLRVTWPLCWPAVVAAGLTAFAMSFDDFLVSFFTAGVSSDTLPMRLYALVKYGSNPETYALSSMILIATAGVFAGVSRLQTKRR